MPIEPLSLSQLDELIALEQRVRAADAIELKLDWPTIRAGATAASLIHREDDGSLTGYLGLYAFGGAPEVELTGMVDPRHRRRQVASRLLAAGLARCAEVGLTHRLLVVPRQSAAGQAFAARHSGELDHSEFSLQLTGQPLRSDSDPATSVRPATRGDRSDHSRILTDAFGSVPQALLDEISSSDSVTMVVEHCGHVIGTARLSLADGVGAIHGFAIDAEHRGRGIGRDVLGRFADSLRAQGAERVRLEVAVENERALVLYTSTGFEPVGTEDYFRLPVSSSA